MPITLPPTPPSITDPENFAERADAWNAWVVTFVAELNTIIGTTIPAGSAAAGTLTGDTVAANVVNSALQNLGVQSEALDMGNFKITAIAAAVARTDASQYAQVQNSTPALLSSVAGTNTITALLTPTLTAYTAGQKFTLTPFASNSGAATINIDSLGAKNIFSGGAALRGYEMKIGVPLIIEYDGTQFNIIGAQVHQVQMGRYSSADSVSGTNTITASLTPSPVTYLAGMVVQFVPANKNTGATTLNLNSLGAQNIFYQGAALGGGELAAGVNATVVYDGSQFNLVAPGTRCKALTFTRDTSSVSGNVSYTGIGFRPRAAVFFMAINGSSGNASMGVDDGAIHLCIRDNDKATTDTWGISGTESISCLVSGTTLQEGHVLTWDADGFTIAWTKTSTPGASTMAIQALCFG